MFLELARGHSQARVSKTLKMSQTRLSVRLSEIRTAWAAADRVTLLQLAKQKGYLPAHEPIVAPAPLPDGLRPSYLRVLHGVNAGRSYPQIAEALGVSCATLRTYVSALYAHFGVAALPELVRVARAAGLVADLGLRYVQRDRALQPKLSQRQLEALDHSRQNRGPTEIARLWRTTVANAHDALREARLKLNAASTSEAVSKAIGLGLLAALPGVTHAPFSRRQREVLSLLARGYSRREIGEELEIGRLTAGKYISEMRARVRANDDNELLSIASDLRLMKPDKRFVARIRIIEVDKRRAIALTPRQYEVADAIVRWRHKPYREIATQLDIALGTIHSHVRVLKHRLNLAGTSREEFARAWQALKMRARSNGNKQRARTRPLRREP